MDRFLQTLMDALAVGSLYALIALGYTMVYGILKFINFAHSDIFVLGAWTSFGVALCAGYSGADQPIAAWVLIAAGVLAGGGLLFSVYERVIARGRARTALGGPLVMLGSASWAMIGLVHVARWLKDSPSLAILAGGVILVVAMGTCGIVSFSLERLAYKPLRKAPRLNVLITAIGVSLLLQNTGQLNWMFGTRPDRMPTLVSDQVLNRTIVHSGPITIDQGGATIRLEAPVTFEPGRTYRLEIVRGDNGAVARVGVRGLPREGVAVGAMEPLQISPAYSGEVVGSESVRVIRDPRVPIRLVDVLGASTAVLLMIILDWLVFRTKVGRAMRAVSFHPQNAALMGINVDRVISFTFVLGAMLAAAAGFLYAQKYPGLNQTAAAVWVLLGLKAFVAAVVGGIGNIRGAMLGGILIGLLEFFGAAYISSELRDLYVFSLLIVVLLFKPSGILGKSAIEKV